MEAMTDAEVLALNAAPDPEVVISGADVPRFFAWGEQQTGRPFPGGYAGVVAVRGVRSARGGRDWHLVRRHVVMCGCDDWINCSHPWPRQVDV